MKSARGKSRSDAGYALLMAIFMVASLFLFAAMATPSVLIEGRRERDREAIWRGNQYDRAIRLYYQKNGKYPQTLEDITKADVSGAHYLRKAYKDLNNPDDGSWRMIYVSPTGQLIGSVRYHTLQEMSAALGLGIQVGGAVPASTGPAGTTAPSSTTTSQTGQGQQSGFSSLQPMAPLEPVTGPVLGGFLIGVGGKQKRPSVVVYQGGKRYYDWEFIWNPLTSTNGTGQAATGLVSGAAPAAGSALGSSFGTSGTQQPATTVPGAPTNPMQTLPPGTPQQNPVQ